MSKQSVFFFISTRGQFCFRPQARRLRRCTAGGDFLDHSSDSIVTSLSGLVAMRTLLLRPAFLPPSQPSLLFSLPFTEDSASRTISLGQADCFAFIMISQLPFFIATWAHPIVGRTILSSSLDGVDWFSVSFKWKLILYTGDKAGTRVPTVSGRSAGLLQQEPLISLSFRR